MESIWFSVFKGRDKAIELPREEVSTDNILNKVKKFLNIINQMLTNMTLRRLQTTRPPLFWIFSNQSKLDFSIPEKKVLSVKNGSLNKNLDLKGSHEFFFNHGQLN